MNTIHIEGTGCVARALAPRLAALGRRVTVGGRNQSAAGTISESCDAELLEDSAPITSEVVLILVRDDAICDVAEALVPRLNPRTSVLHASGFHDCGVLAALTNHGCPVGWAHPLGSFSGQTDPDWMLGLTWCLGGEPDGVRAGRTIAEGLGGHPFLLANRPGAKARYHAAASLLAGGAAALFDLAEDLVAEDLPDPHLLRQGLGALLISMTEQASREGPRAALTGPAARGDQDVLAGQLAVMDPKTRALYSQLIEHMQAMAFDPKEG